MQELVLFLDEEAFTLRRNINHQNNRYWILVLQKSPRSSQRSF